MAIAPIGWNEKGMHPGAARAEDFGMKMQEKWPADGQ
jgi:hypothetical protein